MRFLLSRCFLFGLMMAASVQSLQATKGSRFCKEALANDPQLKLPLAAAPPVKAKSTQANTKPDPIVMLHSLRQTLRAYSAAEDELARAKKSLERLPHDPDLQARAQVLQAKVEQLKAELARIGNQAEAATPQTPNVSNANGSPRRGNIDWSAADPETLRNERNHRKPTTEDGSSTGE